MTRFSYILFCSIFACQLQAQNLVPNSGFEEGYECNDEIISLVINNENITHWYAAGGTPDWLHFDCNGETTASIDYWHPQTPPEGNAYAHFIGLVSLQGGFYNESLGVRLLEPLEEGRAYDFSAQVFVHFDPLEAGFHCVEPHHRFQLFASVDSFQMNNIPLSSIESASYPNGRVVFTDSSGQMSPLPLDYIDQIIPWFEIGGCFTGRAGEQYLGFGHNTGWADDWKAPCAPDYTDTGALLTYGLNIDEVRLIPYPRELTARDTVCFLDAPEIDLRTYIDNSRFTEATFIWSDGYEGATRFANVAGTQEITVRLPCADIPLFLTLEEEECSPDVYLPTAFSPNDDGINDTFRPAFASPADLLRYHLQIFDRWGNLLFENDNPTTGWDGNFRGRAAADVYVFVLEYDMTGENGVRSFIKTGNVTLLR